MNVWKSCAAAGLLWAFAACVSGCSTKTDISGFTENTLAVNKDGSVTELATESFGEEYYSLEELEAYVSAQVEAYNLEHPSGSEKEEDAAIIIDEVRVEDGAARVVLTYDTAGDYADFNYTRFELAAATDIPADAAGLDFSDAQGGRAGSLSAIEGLEDYKAVIAEAAHNIAVPGKIAYVGGNVTVSGQSLAQSDGTLSVILYR